MKYIFLILICFISLGIFAQSSNPPLQPRSTANVTVLDSSLFTGKSFRIPVFTDTTAANRYKTLDSSGKLIYTYDVNNVWFRSVNHKWLQFGQGGGTVIINGLDSVTFQAPNLICTWTGGFSNCFALDQFFDSVSQNYNSTRFIYYNNGNVVDSVDGTTGIPADSIFFTSPFHVNDRTVSMYQASNTDSGWIAPFQKLDSIYISNDSLYQTSDGFDRFVGLTSSGGSDTTKIPLAGTQPWQRVTGDIEFNTISDNRFLKTTNGLNERLIGFTDDGDNKISLSNSDGTNSSVLDVNNGSVSFQVTDKVIITSTNLLSKGISGAVDFTPNITDLDYVQKKYVDKKADTLNTRIDSVITNISGGGITTSQLTDSLDNRAESYWKVGGNHFGSSSLRSIGSYSSGINLRSASTFKITDSSITNYGFPAMKSLLTYTNVFMGTFAGQFFSDADGTNVNNVGIGKSCLSQMYTGSGNGNTAIGTNALGGVQSGNFNVGVGFNSVSANTNPVNYNTGLGSYTLPNLTNNATSNIAVGYGAGYNSTSQSNELIINSIIRSGRNGDTTLSIIYGNQNTTVAGQRLKINARLVLPLGAANNYVLTSDAVGNASWQAPAGGSAAWGSITGTLSSQTDLQSALNAKSPIASPTFTGTVTIPTPFTLGATSVTSTGTQLNYLNAATGTTGTTSTNLVFSTSPTLVTPNIGAATGTSVNLSSTITASNFAESSTSVRGGTGSNLAGTTNNTIFGQLDTANTLTNNSSFFGYNIRTGTASSTYDFLFGANINSNRNAFSSVIGIGGNLQNNYSNNILISSGSTGGTLGTQGSVILCNSCTFPNSATFNNYSANSQIMIGSSIVENNSGSAKRNIFIGSNITQSGFASPSIASVFIGSNAALSNGVQRSVGIGDSTKILDGETLSTVVGGGAKAYLDATYGSAGGGQAVFGYSAFGGAWRSTVIGALSQNLAVSGTVIGYGSYGAKSHLVAIGRGTYAPGLPDSIYNAANPVLLGGDNATDMGIANWWGHRFPTPPTGITITSFTPSSRTLMYHGQDAYDALDSTDTNKDAGHVGIAGGRGTGTGLGGEIRFYTAPTANYGGNKKSPLTIQGKFFGNGNLVLQNAGTYTDNGSKLQVVGSMSLAYVSKATSYTATTSDYTIEVTATGQTITLPTAVGCTGRIYTIKLTASGSGTVATTSSQTIDGSTTYSLSAQYKYVTVQSNNANWIIVANN